MEFDRSLHSMTTIGDDLLIVTGSIVSYSRQKAEMLNLRRNSWSQLADLCVPRYGHSSCSFDAQYVYLFCGHISSRA